MKILIVTDAWLPQINGVVTTLRKTQAMLTDWGHEVQVVEPSQFKTVPCPGYNTIRLAVFPKGKLSGIIQDFQPDSIHIATEGPLGIAARSYCKRKRRMFTTSFHTRFAEYIKMYMPRMPVSLKSLYAYLRWFHSPALNTLVATPSLHEELKERDFSNLARWSRGVDLELFRPRSKDFIEEEGPVFMYMGRVSVEKNIDEFLKLDLPGCKYVIGDGPYLETLKQRYPEVRFTGFKKGEELASYLAAADVFVFPSLTDTFGLVMLEAMACGVPVAAFPVTGPKDVVIDGKTGYLDEDLKQAALKALELNPEDCCNHARQFSWENCSQQFLSYAQRLQQLSSKAA